MWCSYFPIKGLKVLNVKLNALAKVNGFWRDPGETVQLSDAEAKRLIDMGAAVAATGEVVAPQRDSDEVAAMKAELERLKEFERQQLAAAKAAKALAEKEEADRKAADAKAKKEAADKTKADKG